MTTGLKTLTTDVRTIEVDGVPIEVTPTIRFFYNAMVWTVSPIPSLIGLGKLGFQADDGKFISFEQLLKAYDPEGYLRVCRQQVATHSKGRKKR